MESRVEVPKLGRAIDTISLHDLISGFIDDWRLVASGQSTAPTESEGRLGFLVHSPARNPLQETAGILIDSAP